MKNNILYKEVTTPARVVEIGNGRDQKPSIYSLVLRDNKGYQIIPYESIMHCQADGNYTIVNTVQGDRFMTCKTLKEIEQKLPSHSFIRIHQSHVVSLHAIRSVDQNQMIHLSNGQQLPLARRVKSRLFVALGIK